MIVQLATVAEPGSAPAEAEIRARVASMPHITRRIAQDPALPAGASAVGCLQEALKFLDVAAASTDPVAPSKAVDVAWHHFILFTRDYMSYCADHLGRFVHHIPDDNSDDVGLSSDSHAYVRTRELIEQRFGDVDPILWPDADALSDCQPQGNCSSECSGDCSGN